MSDENTYEIIVNTPEEVAYKLMKKVSGKNPHAKPKGEEYLHLYSKCLRVVKGELPETVLK